MRTDIFTGGKGGSGKTMFSLCVSVNLLDQGQNPLIIDYNIFNPDIYELLSRAKTQGTFTKSDFTFTPIEGNKGWVVMPSAINSGNYILPHIGKVYADINKIIEIANSRNIRTKRVIVDTGFHVANLLMPEQTTHGQTTPSWLTAGETNHLTQRELHVWFLWTFASLERSGEKDSIQQVIDSLDSYQIGDFSDQHLHHIFNPYPLYSPRDFFAWFLPDDFNKLTQAAKAGAIGLPVMINDVSNALRDKQGRAIRRDRYPEYVAKTILKCSLNKRPINFYPIPKYDNLTGYTDRLLEEKIELETIKQQLGEAFYLISGYLV